MSLQTLVVQYKTVLAVNALYIVIIKFVVYSINNLLKGRKYLNKFKIIHKNKYCCSFYKYLNYKAARVQENAPLYNICRLIKQTNSAFTSS